MIEEGNENLNQGNILLALRTGAEEARARDEGGRCRVQGRGKSGEKGKRGERTESK